MEISYHGARGTAWAHGVGGSGHMRIGTILTMTPMMSDHMDVIELT